MWVETFSVKKNLEIYIQPIASEIILQKWRRNKDLGEKNERNISSRLVLQEMWKEVL